VEFSLFELRRRHYGISGVPFENQNRLKLVFSVSKTAFQAMKSGGCGNFCKRCKYLSWPDSRPLYPYRTDRNLLCHVVDILAESI
jgi:hypothetical protein